MQSLIESYGFEFRQRHWNGKSRIFWRKEDKLYITLIPGYLVPTTAKFQKTNYNYERDLQKVLDGIEVRKVLKS